MLVVFSFFSLFSVKYRPLAKEAFNCVFRIATLRPCEGSLDRKIRAKVVSTMLEKSPAAARFVNVHFETLSWVFTIIFFASFAYVIYGAYNIVTVGTCDPAHPENCPVSGNRTGTVCDITGDFVEFYGAECPHCRAMIPVVESVEEGTGIVFEKREVWHNKTNAVIMALHADDIKRDCGMLGVPTFYSMKTGRAVCGEIQPEELKQFVINNN